MEKVKIYREAMTDFQNASEILLTLPQEEEERDSVITIAEPHLPRPAVTEIQIYIS